MFPSYPDADTFSFKNAMTLQKM